MGSLDIKSDQRPEHEIASSESESMVDSPTISDKNDLLELMSDATSASVSDPDELILHSPTAFSEENERKISPFASRSSSISSVDSMLEDPFQDFESEHDEKGDYTSETPPIQVMERPTSGKYRIPSSVFARKKSIGTEWGMPSNESLFSINIGSMIWRSDSASGPMFELDETGKTRESDVSDESQEVGEDDKIHGLSEISFADEPVKRNSQEDQEDQGRKSVADERTSRFSVESESTKSFAFPILTADTPTKAVSETEKSESQLDTQPEQEKQPQSSSSSSTTWTKCFGCCTFCS